MAKKSTRINVRIEPEKKEEFIATVSENIEEQIKNYIKSQKEK